MDLMVIAKVALAASLLVGSFGTAATDSVSGDLGEVVVKDECQSNLDCCVWCLEVCSNTKDGKRCLK